MTAGGVAAVVASVLFVAAIVVVIVVIILRLSRQRVSVSNGRVVSTDGIRQASDIAVIDVGAALSIPANDNGAGQYQFGVFDYGGIILLDRSLRLLRVIRHYAGSKLDLQPIFDGLQVPRKENYAGRTRKDLIREFPGALGFWQLRGQLFWAVAISLMILVPILLILPVVVIVVIVGVLFSS